MTFFPYNFENKNICMTEDHASYNVDFSITIGNLGKVVIDIYIYIYLYIFNNIFPNYQRRKAVSWVITKGLFG